MRIKAIWSFLGLAALGAGGMLSGCDSDDPAVKSGVGESCVKTSDCGDGLKCLEGACYKGSTTDGEGGSASEPGPPPPVLSGLGESCTKRADCEEELRCFNARCTDEPEGMGGSGPGVTLGAIGETCVVTSDCTEPLSCLPSAGLGSVGVCTPATTGLTPTGNDCHAECTEAADCCQLPVLYHQPWDALTFTYGTGAASCVELKSLLTAVNCASVATTAADLARCFAYDTFCTCGDDTWSCSDVGACVYETECTVSGAAPGGCPALSRSGRQLLQACSADGACAAPAGCTNDASCTGKPVADAPLDLCVANECTCYNELGCYRKCSIDLDCAVGQVCNDDAVCETAPFCESDEHCAALSRDYRSKCSDVTSTCYIPCETDRDCNPAGVTGQLAALCDAEHMCQPIGCTSDNDCPAPGGVNAGGVKNFCTPKLDPAFVPVVASAITDGP